MNVSLENARHAKEEAKRRFKGDRDVVGIGIGQRGASYCLRINLLTTHGGEQRPDSIAGVPVMYIETGPIRAQRAG